MNDLENRIDLMNFQADFLDSHRRFPAFVGGIGTGKTMMLLLKIWNFCEEYPNTLALIVRKEYTDLHDCFDDQTEILTDRGWKRFNDVKRHYEVMSLDPKTGIANYEKTTKIIKQEYEGEMYEIDTGSRSFCVTPNHKMLVKHESSLNGKKHKTKDWKLKEISQIKPKSFFIKKDMKWEGEEQENIEILNHNRGSAKNHVFKMDDWLEFLGWFISEGYTHKHKTKKTWWVAITQSLKANEDNCNEIADLLSRMGLSSRMYNMDRFVTGSRAICEHLNHHCLAGANNKRVPGYVKYLSPRQIRIFLESFNKGDGYVLKDGTRRFNTSSKQLADDLQELIVKSGKYATISVRDNIGKETWYLDHYIKTKSLDYLVIEYSDKHKSFDSLIKQDEIMRKQYKGYIYCVETEPHHTIYTRRHGRCMWSGNSTIKDFERYFGEKVNTHKEYNFANKSTIMFRHASELNVLKNINLTIVGIEQAEEFDTDETFIFLRDRLRRDNAPFRQICLIANVNGHNWIWKHWKNNPRTVEYDLTEATTFDNEKNLPPDFIADLKTMEIEAPNHYRRYVVNDWEEADGDDFLFTWKELNAATCVDINVESYQRAKILGVDVARFGDDETVFTILESRGEYQWEQTHYEKYRKKDLMWTVGRVIDIRRELDITKVVVDDDGLGGGVTDRLRELGVNIVAFKGGEKAKDFELYYNKRSESFFKLKDMISKGYLKLLKDDEATDQMLTIRYKYAGSKGLKAIVSKDELKKEGIRSPDMADALMMAASAVKGAGRKKVFVPQTQKIY